MTDMFGEDLDTQSSGIDPAAEFLAQQQNEIAGKHKNKLLVNTYSISTY